MCSKSGCWTWPCGVPAPACANCQSSADRCPERHWCAVKVSSVPRHPNCHRCVCRVSQRWCFPGQPAAQSSNRHRARFSGWRLRGRSRSSCLDGSRLPARSRPSPSQTLRPSSASSETVRRLWTWSHSPVSVWCWLLLRSAMPCSQQTHRCGQPHTGSATSYRPQHGSRYSLRRRPPSVLQRQKAIAA